MAKKSTPKTKTDNTNKPWVDNYPVLQDWLRAIEARCFSQIRTGGDEENPTGYLETYLLPGNVRPFIVEVRANKMGWEIYTPCGSITTWETLEDANRRLGLPENKGIVKNA